MYFEINNKFAIGAEVYETRYSWGHKAHLYRKTSPELQDEYIVGDKITYYNRTWESFQFESIMFSIVAKAAQKRLISKEEAEECNQAIKNHDDKESGRELKSVSMVMAMGDLLAGDGQKSKNDWKARMLKAGLEGKGLIMPDDWSELDEDTKQARLDAVIQVLAA